MKPVYWIASSKKDLCEFPEDVRQGAGYAIHLAQLGEKAINAVPMVGFGCAQVLEVVIDEAGDTFRAVYTVRFRHAVYVLHAFQKKSKSGISTPKPDMDLIKSRFKKAEQHYQENHERQQRKGSGHGAA